MKILEHTPDFPPSVFIAEIDGSKARTLRAFYPRISKVLLFPDYFGKNLDALFDCLCSLEVTGQQEVVLLIRHPHFFLDKEKPEKKEAALQVLRDSEKEKNRYDSVHFQVIGVRS